MTPRIMIVDDEAAIGKLLMYQLGGCGYQVTYVPDGLMALQRLERERPDLILLDVMMPAISGWEVCRLIRANSSVPIIMLTAKHADADVVAGLTSGADDYIAKPFSLAQLQARIEAVLRRARPAKQERRNLELTLRPLDERSSDTAEERLLLPAADIHSPPANQPMRLGQSMRAARLARGVSLHQASLHCQVRWEFLQAIEQENFTYMPRIQLHTALHAYATYLGLNLRDLAGQPAPIRRTLPQFHYATAVAVLLLLVVSLYILTG